MYPGYSRCWMRYGERGHTDMKKRACLVKGVQEEDRILLYGRGRNGWRIYHYLVSHHFQVIGFVDQNADIMDGGDVAVYCPEQLRTIPPEEYDKIVITVLNQDVGAEIYRLILKNGVEEQKIAAPYIYAGPASTLLLEDVTGRPAFVKREIEKFIERQYGDLRYFKPLIEALKAHKKERNALLQKIKCTDYGLAPLEEIVFLYVLYLGDIFDAELMERLIRLALKIHRPELRQFLHMIFNDTFTMCFMHPEYLFPDFYTLRRTFLRKMCGMYDFQVKAGFAPKSGAEAIKKICVLNHTLFTEKAASTLFSVQMCNILADLGYEVRVIPLDIFSYMLADTPVFRTFVNWPYSSSEEFAEYHKKAYRPEVTIEYTTGWADIREQMQCQLDKIMDFSPDLIIDVSDEWSVLSPIYSQYFKTLYFPIRGYQSSSCFTHFVTGERSVFNKANRIYHSVEKEPVMELPLFISPPPSQAVYSRRQYSLAEDDFVLVTVGSRLDTEMSEEFIDCVCGALLNEPGLKWLIVGSMSVYINEKYKNCLREGKIVYIPYEHDLLALYQICDVYLNPERQGGVASVLWAAMCGLPLAMVRMDCDQAKVVGLEYMTEGTYEQVMDYVLAMKRNPGFYAGESDKFRHRILHYEGQQKKFWKDLIEALEDRAVLSAESEQKGDRG